MKLATGFILLLLSWNCYADSWSKEELEKQWVITVLKVVDWKQTRNINKHCATLHEVNPVLGECPSDKEVDKYMGITLGLNWLLAHYSDHQGRGIMQKMHIGITESYIRHNATLGLGVMEGEKDYGIGIQLRWEY